MKKLCSVMIVFLMMLTPFSVLSATGADAEFDIQSGVLVKYNGSGTDVTIPNDVKAIGASAFAGNTKLRTLKMTKAVRSVGERAFYGCSSLQNVSSADNVVEVGDLAFYGTPYLDQSSIKYLILGNVLLWYNGTSESVTIPSRCTAVASYAFARCEYLRSFTAYEGLTQIGTGAFYGCSELSSVNLPITLGSVGAYAFDGTPYLKNAGEFAVAGDGVLLKYQGSATTVTVPDHVHRIAAHAFVSSKIKSVTVPKSVYSIDAYAFADCTGLETVDLPEGLVTIGDGAFRGCKALETVKTPSSLSYLGQFAFSGDAALDHVVLFGDQLAVSHHAFHECGGLHSVLMTEGVAKLYADAFDSCNKLEGISIPSKTGDISQSALKKCGNVVVSCEDSSPAQSALTSNYVDTLKGDADRNHNLNVVDATCIQLYIAMLKTFNGAQIASADMNYDGEINIRDAFAVQMKLVNK